MAKKIYIPKVTGNVSINVVAKSIESSDGEITLNPTSMTLTEEYASEIITATLTGNLVGSTVTWMSSNTTVASVTNGGKVTALANGTCTITATCGSKSASCSVTVNIENTDGDTVPCTEVTLNKTTLNFTDSYSQQLIATVTPTNTTDSITWTSNDSSIASVNDKGYVTPKANGYCEITVTCGNYSASCSVTVNVESFNNGDESNSTNIPCTSVSLSETSIYFIDSTPKRLVATFTPSNTTDTITWTSSGNTIASVSNAGIVTPIADGTCTITVTCGSKSATCSVTVNMNNSGGESGESTAYTNPTITYDPTMYKAKLTQDGYTEYIDVSYIKNTGQAYPRKQVPDSVG